MLAKFLEELPTEWGFVILFAVGIGVIILIVVIGLCLIAKYNIFPLFASCKPNGNGLDKKLDCLSEEIEEDIIQLLCDKGYKDHEGVNSIITDRLKQERESSERVEVEREKRIDEQFIGLEKNMNIQFETVNERIGSLETTMNDNIATQSTFVGKINQFIKTLEGSHLTRGLIDEKLDSA